MISFACEGLSAGRRVAVQFADAHGNVLSSIPVLPLNASSIVVASPNWLFTFYSSVTFTADVSVSLLQPADVAPHLRYFHVRFVIALPPVFCGMFRVVVFWACLDKLLQVFYDDVQTPISNTSVLRFTFIR